MENKTFDHRDQNDNEMNLKILELFRNHLRKADNYQISAISSWAPKDISPFAHEAELIQHEYHI